MDIFSATWIDVLILLTWVLATAVAKSLGPAFLLSYAAVWVYIAVFFGYFREPFANVLQGSNLVVSYLVLWITVSLPMIVIIRFGPKLLGMSFANLLGRRLDFVLEGIYYRPDGSVIGRTTLNNHVEAPWTGSRHWHALGWNASGNWHVGLYRVDVYEGDDLIATGNFAIVDPPESDAATSDDSCVATTASVMANPTGKVTSIDGRVEGFRFFEKGSDRIPVSERIYQTTFPKETTRRVAWELHLTYSPPYARAYHLIGWAVGILASSLTFSVITSVLMRFDNWAIAQKIEESRLATLMAGWSDVIIGGFVAITNDGF